MNIDNFDTWFGIKKVTTGKGEELEQYRDLFEECWNESRAELPKLRERLEEAQAELEDATDGMYTEDEVDEAKDEVAAEIEEGVSEIVNKFRENFATFMAKYGR